MSAAKIDKRTDPAVRHLRRVRDGDDAERIFCEGFRLVEELLKSGWPPVEAFVTPQTAAKAEQLFARLGPTSPPVRVMSEDVMNFVSGVDSAPGLIVIARKRYAAGGSKGMPLVLVLHGLQLPQNVGAVLRSAEAAGVSEVWTSKSTADPFNPKAIRGSSGSVFRLPVRPHGNLPDIVKDLKARGIFVVAANQGGAVSYERIDWAAPTALVVGSEGAGFTGTDASLFDQTIRIPMAGSVESLNVANAASICLFEAARQRRAILEKGRS